MHQSPTVDDTADGLNRPLDRKNLAVALRGTICGVGFALLPTALFGIASSYVYISRPSINLDYLLLAVLFGVGVVGVRWSSVALTLAILVDLVVATSPIYFMDPGEILHEAPIVIGSRPVLAIAALAGLLAIVAASYGTFAALRSILGERRPAYVAFVVAVATVASLATLLDVVAGNSLTLRYSAKPLWRANFATSGALGVLLGRLHIAYGTPTDASSAMTSAVQLAGIANLTAAQADKRTLVVILVESWGALKSSPDAPLFEAQQAFQDLDSVYSRTSGYVRFRGSTVAGEFRELCGVLRPLPRKYESFAATCLPVVLRTAGFETIAVHAYHAGMFDRAQWYPKLGFRQAFFLPQLDSAGLRSRCGMMHSGVCDDEVAEWIGTKLLAPRQRSQSLFVYWMTLSGHLPVSQQAISDAGFDCQSRVETSRYRSTCAWAMRTRQTLLNIARLSRRLAPIRPTVLLVGDHAPPFALRSARNAFIPDSVPFMLLKSR